MGRATTIPPDPVLWHERKAFINASTRIEGLILWSSLRELLPFFESLLLPHDLVWDSPEFRGALSTRMVDVIDSWADKNGYSDIWMKEVGLYQLYRWSLESRSKQQNVEGSLSALFSDAELQAFGKEGLIFPESDWTALILMPPYSYSKTAEGMPSEFRIPLLSGWRPNLGESWEEFATGIRSQVESALKTYKKKCLKARPELAHLRGYAHYEELAKYQGRLHQGTIDETTLKQIKRTAQRLGLTLRGHRSVRARVLKQNTPTCEKESGGAKQAK